MHKTRFFNEPIIPSGNHTTTFRVPNSSSMHLEMKCLLNGAASKTPTGFHSPTSLSLLLDGGIVFFIFFFALVAAWVRSRAVSQLHKGDGKIARTGHISNIQPKHSNKSAAATNS